MSRFLSGILLALCLTFPGLTQNDTTKTEDEWEDTTWTEDDWDEWDEWESEKHEDWKDDFQFDVFEFAGAPTISGNYGLAKLTNKKFSGSFAEPRSFQLKLGYTDANKTWQNQNIMESNFKYISLSNITTDLANISETDSDIETNSWRIGIGKSNGYGYSFGSSALILSSGSSVDWTRIKMLENPADSLDRNITDLYNNTFRFGTSFEASVRFQIIREISIEANYERAVVFPRHLFWKWLGSAVIENVGQFLVDKFVNEILDSSPYFAPVISFLLKNGLNYGLYELRKEKMNWPFNSTSPMMYDQFKVGLTFVL